MCRREQGKQGAYARIGVREYWIVDPQTRTIEVLVLGDEAYTLLGTFTGDDQVRSRVLPDLAMAAQRFFPRV